MAEILRMSVTESTQTIRGGADPITPVLSIKLTPVDQAQGCGCLDD